MSIFSNIRKSRQQAKEHNAKVAEQKRKEEDVVPYRHVPTHAASDAFASAPPSWREISDRPKIIEQNRRRSAMAANAYAVTGMSALNAPGVNFPRVGSSLSFVSYPGQGMGITKGRMPRAYSYNGVSAFATSPRDVIYSIPDVSQSEPDCLEKRSPIESNKSSSSSQEDLEMGSQKAPMMNTAFTTEAAVASSTHRLHPTDCSRRTSDASLDRRAKANTFSQRAAQPSSSRDTRPPVSTRGFTSIPKPASATPIQGDTASIPLQIGAIAPTEARKPSPNCSRQVSSSSLPGLAPASSKQPSPMSTASPALSSTPNSIPTAGFDVYMSYFNEPVKHLTTDYQNLDSQTSSKMARFTEEEPSGTLGGQNPVPISPSRSDVINLNPELAATISQVDPTTSKGKRLSKGGGGKLMKKNRRGSVQPSAV